MVLLTRSYGDNYRVFIPTDSNITAHESLKERCMWGGCDKRMTVEGVEYMGYEFPSINKATEAINFASYYLYA